MVDGSSSSTSAAAAAECHYRSGRHGAALAELEGSGRRRTSPLVVVGVAALRHRGGAGPDGPGAGDDGAAGAIMTADPAAADVEDGGRPAGSGSGGRVEFLALPPLANAADAAMCRLRGAAAGTRRGNGRTAASSSAAGKGEADLLEEAMESNGAYRRALRGAVRSLLEGLASRRRGASDGEENDGTAAEAASIRRGIGEAALAVLVAAASASYLHLRAGRGDGAWGVLEGDAGFAASALTEAADEDGDGAVDSEMDGDGGGAVSDNAPFRGVDGSLAALSRLLPDGSAAALASLRTALKAAALASGRVVLAPPPADCPSDGGGDGPARKRRRTRPDAGGGSSRDGGAWCPAGDATPDPAAAARERLADGLAYHVASRMLPTAGSALVRDLRERRDACLAAAEEWEGRARELDTTPRSPSPRPPSSGGSGGHAWRVACCLRLTDRPPDGTDGKVPSGLADSSSFARKLAALDLARDGDHLGALGMLRRCLDDDGGGCGRDDGSDGEASKDHAVGCAARCLLASGEAGPALELMLHLARKGEGRRPGGRSEAGPCALLVPAGGGAISVVAAGRHSKEDGEEDGDRVLWGVFAAASLACDWPTCLSALENMDSESPQRDAARAFALLQCGSGDGVATGLESAGTGEPLEGAASLYRADALLQANGGRLDPETVALCTARALERLDGREVDGAAPSPPSDELLAAALCDHGIALLARGDAAGALVPLRRSSSLAATPRRRDARPAFNLALLLVREGRLDEACDGWLAVRGHREDWRAALAGGRDATSAAALARLRGTREVAANRHGLFLAGRRVALSAAAAAPGESSSDDPRPTEGYGVDGWSPPSDRDGGDGDAEATGPFESQATALDVLMLRHAVQGVERKRSAGGPSSLFRRPG